MKQSKRFKRVNSRFGFKRQRYPASRAYLGRGRYDRKAHGIRAVGRLPQNLLRGDGRVSGIECDDERRHQSAMTFDAARIRSMMATMLLTSPTLSASFTP